MNYLTGPYWRLHLALLLLLILTGCATAPPPSVQAPLPPATAPAAPDRERTEAVPVVAAEAPLPPVKTDPCQEEQLLGTVDACAGFLRSCPSVPRRQDILAQMYRLIEEQKGDYKDYKKFVLEFEDGLQFVPYRHRLLLTGPEGLRVHDCLESLKGGEESGVVLEKVRKRKGVYRDFTDEEIDTLKQMGLTGDLIQAMLESTHDAKRAEKALQKNKYGAASPSGGYPLQMRRDERYSSGDQQPVPVRAPGGYGPSPEEALANCAAQSVALEGCKRLSGFAQSMCNSAVKVQFPCQ